MVGTGMGPACFHWFPTPTPLTFASSIYYPVLGFLGPDITEVIIQLLNIQWNSHVKRNKTENKIHPDT